MRSLPGRFPATPSTWIAAVAAAVALYSAWHSGGHVWRRLSADYRTYAAYSDLQRQHAPLDKIPLPSNIFDFYAEHLQRGDRIYFQVQPGPFGNYLDLPGIIAAAGNFYLLPAVQVTDLRRATVVVSFNESPGRLHLHFAQQAQYGPRLIYVSRLAG
jgi:hypothetical protein